MGCIEHCVDRQRRDDLWGVRDDDGMSAVHIVAAAAGVAVAVAADNNTLDIALVEAGVVDNYWLRNQQQFASHQVHA